jgi:lipopolysaccharide export LptBFGC system permease protein LptF
LFAAAMVYGRLAADNELAACRAAGINIHRLFLSAILLSVFVAAFSLLFVNFVIPDCIGRITDYARANLSHIALQKLRNQGRIAFQQYSLTAEDVEAVESEKALRERGLPFGPGLDYLLITAPTFLQTDAQGRVKRFTTAKWGLCQFDTRGGELKVTLHVGQARDFDGRMELRFEYQKIGPLMPPSLLKRRPAMADLSTLRQWKVAPWTADRIRPKVAEFRVGLRHSLVYAHSVARLSSGRTLEFEDASGRRTTVAAASAAPLRKGRVRFSDVRVVVGQTGRDFQTRYVAPQGVLTARANRSGESSVELRLSQTADDPVREYQVRGGVDSSARERDNVTLGALRIPAAVVERMREFPPEVVLDPEVRLPIGAELEEKLQDLRAESRKLQRKVAALIHFRMGFAGSALVTILMGAALGVIFRGSRALAAFGLACIPFGSVTIVVLMGRQIAEHEGSETLGTCIIWGGLLAVAAVDAVIVRLGVKR